MLMIFLSVFNYGVVKLYTNSVMSSLNSRKAWSNSLSHASSTRKEGGAVCIPSSLQILAIIDLISVGYVRFRHYQPIDSSTGTRDALTLNIPSLI